MALKTQAAKMREAANVIETFATLERAIRRGPKDMKFQDVFSRYVRAAFPGDGTGAFVHTEDMSHSRFSNHQRIQAVIWQNELNETLVPLAKSLQELLPGQPLTWELEGAFHNGENRHHLYLGCDTSASNSSTETVPPVIDTVISRWKAPLVRLSNYLDMNEDSSPKQEWFIIEADKTNNKSGPVGMGNFTIVPAHSLQHALRQYSFKKSTHAAVRVPLNPDSYHVAFNVETHSFDPIVKKVETELEEREESVRTENSKLLEMAKEINQGLAKLSTQIKARLFINLKEGTHQFVFHQHPFAHASDMDDEKQIREHLSQLGEKLCKSLCTTLHTIYPNIQEGYLSVEVNKTNTLKENNTIWKFKIDGFQHEVRYGDITPLINVAHSMHKHQKGTLDTAYVVTIERNQPLNVNHNTNMVIVSANTPEHAALTYIGKRNPYKLRTNQPLRLVQLNFPRLQEHADQKKICFERLQKYYK